jgi:hypothetical protein
MGKIHYLARKINTFLRKHDCPKMQGDLTKPNMLFEMAMRAVWKGKDREQREKLSIDIAVALKKYFGGKNLEEDYYELKEKLDKEEIEEKKRAEEEALQQRLKDPNYTPTFDELMDS